MEYNYRSMNTNQRPPIAARRGIAVLQPSKTHKQIDSEEYASSGARSMRSSGRSRGISIGRSSGIRMDKIYQQKHFPLPPHPEEAKGANLERTLTSCKSLKLVSLQSEATIGDKDSALKESTELKAEQEDSALKLKTSSRVVVGKQRGSSPIGKLNFGVESTHNSKLCENQRKQKLIKF